MFRPLEKADINCGLDEIDPDEEDIEAIINVTERRSIPFNAVVKKVAGKGDFNEYRIKWK
jgi:hypothetical protein